MLTFAVDKGRNNGRDLQARPQPPQLYAPQMSDRNQESKLYKMLGV